MLLMGLVVAELVTLLLLPALALKGLALKGLPRFFFLDNSFVLEGELVLALLVVVTSSMTGGSKFFLYASRA